MKEGESENFSTVPGEKTDMDLVGPTQASLNLEIMGLLTKDEASNYLKALGLPDKYSETVALAFGKLYGIYQTERSRLQVVRTDGGSEFKGAFDDLMKKWGVVHVIGNLPDKPTTGSRIERMVQLVSNGTRVSMLRSGLPYQFWCHALCTWCRNFSVSSTNASGKTP